MWKHYLVGLGVSEGGVVAGVALAVGVVQAGQELADGLEGGLTGRPGEY